MAYLRELCVRCSVPGCKRRAAVQLITFRNEERGIFCGQHGRRALKAAEDSERAFFAAGAPGLLDPTPRLTPVKGSR